MNDQCEVFRTVTGGWLITVNYYVKHGAPAVSLVEPGADDPKFDRLGAKRKFEEMQQVLYLSCSK